MAKPDVGIPIRDRKEIASRACGVSSVQIICTSNLPTKFKMKHLRNTLIWYVWCSRSRDQCTHIMLCILNWRTFRSVRALRYDFYRVCIYFLYSSRVLIPCLHSCCLVSFLLRLSISQFFSLFERNISNNRKSIFFTKLTCVSELLFSQFWIK